ncbi:MAG: pentapeptide repeat-containing protein [Methanohalobium sp.]|uniref:pentapeptide repeat-containing protein n=1 Tax=Methanohalobium sp. TaxID=2837493 RepID=UPI003979892E
MAHKSGILSTTILIAIGILLLLNNLQYLPDGFWHTLWNFWPVVLIIIGLDVLAGQSRSKLATILTIVLGLAVIIGTIGFVWSNAESDDKINNLDTKSSAANRNMEGMDYFFRDMSRSNLSHTNLKGSNIFFVDLSNSNLGNEQLNGANILFADLSNCNFEDTDINGANILFVELSGTDISNAKNFKNANILFTG